MSKPSNSFNIFKQLTKGVKFDNNKVKKTKSLMANPHKTPTPKEKDEEISKTTEPQDEKAYESDKELGNIKCEILKLKEKILTTNDPEKLNEYEEEYKHIINRKKQAIGLIRKKYKIKVEGTRVPPPLDSFKKIEEFLKLDKALMRRIQDEIKFVKPTPVQMQTIPIIAKGRDVISLAETGSGKSLSFILPILSKIDPEADGIQAIVLAPTRELLIQLYKQFMVFNPHPNKIKVRFLRRKLIPKNQEEVNQFIGKTKVLLSTPLRLERVLKELDLKFSTIKHIVVDEADALFDMGFLGQVDKILKQCSNPTLQKSFFSATMLPAIEDLLKENMSDPIKLTIGIKNATSKNVDQKLVYCGRESGKIYAVREIFRNGFVPPMLIFVQSKHRAVELFEELQYDGIKLGVIHGDVIKEQRDENVTKLRTGEISVLICSDLMARGIDFLTVNYVVNYDFPQSIVSYIHRVGRTGRAGNRGTALTLFTDDDRPYLRSIANLMKKSGCDVPAWMLELKPASRHQWKDLEKTPNKRSTLSTAVDKNVDKNFVREMHEISKRTANKKKAKADRKQKEQQEEDALQKQYEQMDEQDELDSQEFIEAMQDVDDLEDIEDYDELSDGI